MMTVQHSDLKALQNEVDRLWAESRLLREKAARSWELARATFVRDLISPFLALPMLRGFWATSVNSAGAWYDLSGIGKTLTLNGDPLFAHYNTIGYWYYDGVGDYHSRADEADLSITGLETYVLPANRGLTFGGWFYPVTIPAANVGWMSKWGVTGVSGGYMLYTPAGAVLSYIIEDNVAGISQVTSGAVSTGAWHFVVGRFTPGAEVAVYLDGVWVRNVAGIVANVRDNLIDFEIGAWSANATYMDASAACCFLCAAAASDAQISSVFQQTRGAFGV